LVEPEEPQAAGAPGPNIVVIQTDDQSAETMRVMKRTNRSITRRGATFTNTFTNWPLCCPSRATQLTGQYAHNHGVLGNEPPEGSYTQFARESNLAVWLEDAGYNVGHVGKFLHGYGPSRDLPRTPYAATTEIPPGWTDWRTFTSRKLLKYYGYAQVEWSEGDGERQGTIVKYEREARDFKTDVSTAQAVDLVDEYAESSDPFYLQVDYLAPHAGGPNKNAPRPPLDCDEYAKSASRHASAFDDEPLVPARSPSFNEGNVSDKPPRIARLPKLNSGGVRKIKQEYRCRLESLLAVDEGVAKIMSRLRRTGELADTYVFFTSDNGYFHGEHRITRGKGLVYEPSIRVPLVVRGPAIPAGVRVKDLTSNADFATTVVALTGASPGSTEPDGRSLIPATQSPGDETGRELLIETLSYDAIRTQRYKWVESEGGFRELYDLKRDEDELRNVANKRAYVEVRSLLAERLDELRDCSGASCSASPRLDVAYGGVPQDESCTAGDVTVRVSGADTGEIRRVSFGLDGETLTRDSSSPFEHTVSRSELEGVGPAALSTAAELIDGRRVVWNESIDACP